MDTPLKIGLLQDLTAASIGRRAVRDVLHRALRARGIEVVDVDPFAPETGGLAALLIGGGLLLRAEDDPYYRAFRVPGTHVLHSVSVAEAADTRYLDDYALVAVRSQADRARLGRGEVCPGLGLLLGEHPKPSGGLPLEVPPGAIGVQVSRQLRDHAIGFVHVLCALRLGPVVWLPSSDLGEGGDQGLIEALVKAVPDSIALPAADPDTLWNVVGRLRVMLAPTLHGIGFAYAQRVPFLTYGYDGAVGDFLRDRNLEGLRLDTALDLEPRLAQAYARNAPPPDPAADISLSLDLLDRIVTVAEAALRRPPARIVVPAADRRAHEVRRELSRLEAVQVFKDETQRLRVRGVEATLDRIQHQVSSRSIYTGELEAEQIALNAELRRQHEALGSERQRGEHLQGRVGELSGQLDARDRQIDARDRRLVDLSEQLGRIQAQLDEGTKASTQAAASIAALVDDGRRRDERIAERERQYAELQQQYRQQGELVHAQDRLLTRRKPLRWPGALLRTLTRPVQRALRGLGAGRPYREDGALRFGIDSDLARPRHVGRGTGVAMQGWCFVDGARIHRVEVVSGERRWTATRHAQGRMDVLATFYPQSESSGESLFSGFNVQLDLAAIDAPTMLPLRLEAVLDTGERAGADIGRLELLPGTGREPLAVQWAGQGPRVAVCMATHNPPLTLFAEQIRSIAQQDHANFVCLITDDDSTDDTFAKMQSIVGGDPRFTLIRNDQRLGFYRNFEACLSRVPADADFVALADQDDRWFPDKLSSLLAAFDGDADVQLAYSDCRLVDEHGKVLADSYWTRRGNNWTDLSTMFIANTVTGAASLFRADLLDDVLPFPDRLGEAYHDQWIGLAAMVKGRLAYVGRPLYDYTQHGANVIGVSQTRATGLLDCVLDVVTAVPNLGLVAGRLRSFIMSACYDFEFVEHKSMISRALLARFPDVDAKRRRVLARFARVSRSIPAILGVYAHSRLRRQPTLNTEAHLLRAAVGQRLARPAFRLRARSLLEGRAHEQAWLESVSGARPRASAAAAAPVAAPPPASTPGEPEVIEAMQFGDVFWIAHNVRGFTLDVSADHPRRVNLLMAMIDFRYVFGGYIGMFSLALYLRQQGHRVRIVLSESVDYRPDEWRRAIQKFPGLETLFDEVEVAPRFAREEPLEVSPTDAFIATSCWTAHLAHKAVRELGQERFVFMVQEYEPIFIPYNSIHAIFRESYELPHYALFSTAILKDYFRENRYGVFREEGGENNAAVFHNAISRFRPRREDMEHPQRRLLFYARPENHAARNLFELGVIALCRLLQRPDIDFSRWSFHGIGSIDRRYVLELAKGVNLQLLPRTSLEEYIRLLPTFDVGLSLMLSPHPSLVPLEMAAAGLCTVTNTFENKTAERLHEISPNLIAAAPTVEGIEQALYEAIKRVDDLDARLAGARAMTWPTNWVDAFGPETLARLNRFLG